MMLSVTPKILLPSVWPSPRSLATTCGISVDVLSSPYLDVSVQAVPLVYLLIQYTIPYGGFPHSEISGSQLICSSPKLIAAYHVLHRLLMPRHSPCALFSLTYSGLTIRVGPNIGSLIVELCRLSFQKFFSLAKIVFITLLIKKVFLYCCLLIIAS